jgi:putative membrane protein
MMMGFGMGFIGLFITILFFGVIIFLVVWVVRAFTNNTGTTQSPFTGRSTNAREILDQRYARGEITREQYETMKQDLQ